MVETQEGALAGQQDGPDALVGECHGGPLDGTTGHSRYPKGFLLVDKQAGLAWVYDWNGTAFVCRDETPRAEDYGKRMDAAEGTDWDVQAYDAAEGAGQ